VTQIQSNTKALPTLPHTRKPYGGHTSSSRSLLSFRRTIKHKTSAPPWRQFHSITRIGMRKVTSSPGYSGITMTKNPAPDHINTYPYRAYFPKHSPLQTDSAPKHTSKPHLSTKSTPTSHSIIIHSTKTEVYLHRPSPPAIAFHAPIRVTSKYILHPMHPAPIYANALVPRPILIPSMLSFSTR
jgi:hypothetical protein